MKKYKVTAVIDYHGQDITAVFTLFSENEISANAAVMCLINDFFTRDGDTEISIEEVTA